MTISDHFRVSCAVAVVLVVAVMEQRWLQKAVRSLMGVSVQKMGEPKG